MARRLRNIWYEPVEPSGKYLCHSEFTPGIGINLAKDFTDVVAEQNAEAVILDKNVSCVNVTNSVVLQLKGVYNEYGSGTK